MKKGLLSLLALTLTVVGCQNYDDQFEELTSLIGDLQSEVDGIAAVQTSITSLQSTVAGLSSALTSVQSTVNGVQSSVSGLSNYDDTAVVAQLNQVSSTLADLLLQLQGVASSSELGTISDTLAQVQQDVRELLEGDATINQNITINNEATLMYVETLVSTGTDAPNVIVNGTVTVNTTNFSADQVARTQEIVKKFATVLDDVSITSTHVLDFEKLAFCDKNVTITSVAQDIDALRTITGDLTVTQSAGGAINFNQLTSADDVSVTVTNKNSITSVDFGNASFASLKVGQAGVAANTVDAPKALTINVGNAPVIQIDGDSATDIDHKYNGATALASLNITGSGTIDIIAAKVTGGITIDGVPTSVVNARNLTTTNTFTMPDKVAEMHLPLVKYAAGTINAKVVDLSALLGTSFTTALTVNSTDLDLTGAKSTAAPILTHGGKGHFIITDAANAGIAGAATTQLTVKDLSGALVIPAAWAELHTLNVTGKAAATGAAQNNLVTTSAAASMTTINLSGTIDGLTAAGNTKLKTLTTAGNLTDLNVTGATALTSVNLGHSHISGDTAVTLVITGATSLQSLDMSGVDKVKTITLTGNTKLSSVTAPSTTTLAEAGAAVAVDISDGASFTGVYQNYVAEIPATETTPVIPAVPVRVKQNSLKSLKDWFMVHRDRQTASPTFDVDTALTSGTTTYADFAAATAADFTGAGSGTIDDETEEVPLIIAE